MDVDITGFMHRIIRPLDAESTKRIVAYRLVNQPYRQASEPAPRTLFPTQWDFPEIRSSILTQRSAVRILGTTKMKPNSWKIPVSWSINLCSGMRALVVLLKEAPAKQVGVRVKSWNVFIIPPPPPGCS